MYAKCSPDCKKNGIEIFLKIAGLACTEIEEKDGMKW